MRPHRATRAATARAGDGTRAPPGGPARREADARMHADPTWLGVGFSLLPPRIATLRPGWREGSRRRHGRPAGLARVVWSFRPDVRGPGIQRQGEAATRAHQPPTPLGFSFLHRRPRRE
jgi:hypothetical protein